VVPCFIVIIIIFYLPNITIENYTQNNTDYVAGCQKNKTHVSWPPIVKINSEQTNTSKLISHLMLLLGGHIAFT